MASEVLKQGGFQQGGVGENLNAIKPERCRLSDERRQRRMQCGFSANKLHRTTTTSPGFGE
jgi:hypothetical protein